MEVGRRWIVGNPFRIIRQAAILLFVPRTGFRQKPHRIIPQRGNSMRNSSCVECGKVRKFGSSGAKPTTDYRPTPMASQTVQSVGPNTSRHCFAPHPLENGCDICTVQQLLGRNDVWTTMIYTHALNPRGKGRAQPARLRACPPADSPFAIRHLPFTMSFQSTECGHRVWLARGSVTVNTLPCPSWLSTEIAPP
jgi:hypothetical protein